MNRLDDLHSKEVHTEGFSVVRDAVDAGVAADWRRALATLVERQLEARDERRAIDDCMVHNPMLLDPIFFDVLAHPAVVSALNTFLSDTSIVYAFTTSTMPAGGANYSRRIHVDSPRVIPGYMTNLGVIIALDDFTEANGATYFLPRSFERTDVPSDQEFFAAAERVFPRAGDMVVFNARTFHYGGLNETAQDRHALTINACRSYMRQRFDYPRLIDDDVADTLSPTVRRLLGYDVRVPTSLDEYYVAGDQRLYKANQG